MNRRDFRSSVSAAALLAALLLPVVMGRAARPNWVMLQGAWGVAWTVWESHDGKNWQPSKHHIRPAVQYYEPDAGLDILDWSINNFVVTEIDGPPTPPTAH